MALFRIIFVLLKELLTLERLTVKAYKYIIYVQNQGVFRAGALRIPYGGIDVRKLMSKIMPFYSWIMLTIILSVNYLVYFVTRPFTTGLKHYSMVSSFDIALPFVPFFMFFYLFAYIQWIIGFVMIGRGGREVASPMFIGELIAKGITLACFVFLPTTVEGLRPSVESLQGGGIWCDLAARVFTMDAMDNCFPSVHCLESWICFRGALKLKKVPRWYVYAMLVMTLFVFASTVLVKQHVLIDIVGGVAAVEIGLFISQRLPLKRCTEVK